MSFLEKARKILTEKKAACVIVNEERVIISDERGILPIIKQLEGDKVLTGASVADKVIGKSAAMLLVYGGVKEVYSTVISEHAVNVLTKYGIPFSFGKKVPYIMNREGSGMCPMEEAVLDIGEPEKAYEVLLRKIKEGSKR